MFISGMGHQERVHVAAWTLAHAVCYLKKGERNAYIADSVKTPLRCKNPSDPYMVYLPILLYHKNQAIRQVNICDQNIPMDVEKCTSSTGHQSAF